jgi:hypothetical protein
MELHQSAKSSVSDHANYLTAVCESVLTNP